MVTSLSGLHAAMGGYVFLIFLPAPADALDKIGMAIRQQLDEERDLFSVICRQIAGTLRSSQVALQAKKRIAELNTLHAIGVAISSTLDLGELLHRITLSSAKILQADGSISMSGTFSGLTCRSFSK